ncbi:hypothetical protein NLN81_23885, partial [Citrobacter portucalensis]|nr:hypothetical protein [Citrobacter portucalensis]
TIIKGANYLISEDDITESLFEGQPLVILQSEIPAPIVEYIIDDADAGGGTPFVHILYRYIIFT